MSKEKALQNFRQAPLSLNCAQTIVHAFDREDLVDAMKTCGGGRAPDGLCGALWGAMQVVGPEKADALAEKFEKKLGYRCCLNLKKDGRVPCPTCVATAADLISENT